MEHTDFDTWHRNYLAKEEERKAEILGRLNEAALPELRNNGVDRVVVDYSGYGDSGGIDDITLYSKGNLLAADVMSIASKKVLEEFSYSLLPAGFEINEGGQGQLFLDIPRSTWKLVHGQNYHETSTTTAQGEF